MGNRAYTIHGDKIMANSKISIIIISKNEEKNIEKAIVSAIKALENFIEYEIIVSDSASTDRTIEIAKKYPVNIVQLKSNWFHSPAAGEYIGFHYSTGSYVCFLGSDMELCSEWLKVALEYLKDEQVVGISGRIDTSFYSKNCSKIVQNRILNSFELLKTGEVSILGGPAMFKSDILNQVGCYHPFLKAGEEAELSYRIISKGYKLLRLDIPMVHHNMECVSFKNYIHKYLWNYVIEVGKSIRYTFRTNKTIFSMRANTIISTVVVNCYLVFFIFSLVFFLKGISFPLYIALIGYLLLFFLSIKARKNIVDACFSILIVHIRAVAMGLGFLKNIPDIEDYPTDYTIVKQVK
jgi:glycosyltransferase involved in cell wall biosynthesis